MKARNVLIYVLVIALAFMSVGCGKQKQAEEEIDREIDISLETFEMSGAYLLLKEDDGSGNILEDETGGLSILAAEGETIGSALEHSGYHEVIPVLEGDEFEGWIEYEEVSLGEDEFGFEETEYRLGDRIYTTEELLELPVDADGAMFVAKWAGIPAEDYFNTDTDDAIEDASTSGIFAFCGNGGSIHFVNDDNNEYTTVGYGYSLEDGQTLNDVMGTEYGDTLTDVTKDGAEFTGWTLYEAEDLFWGNEPSEEEDILSLLYNDSGFNGVEYALLRNATVVGENMTTEQVRDITCHGENYLAMANWSE